MNKWKVSSVMLLSFIFWVSVAAYFDSFAGAAIFASAHVLAFRQHILEVKINKLLDFYGLFVTSQDIERQ